MPLLLEIQIHIEEVMSSYRFCKDANEDQRVKTPFQNVVMEEEQFEEDDEIHCMEEKGSASFFTLVAYEKSLFNYQINQEWDVELFCKLMINTDMI